MKASRVFLNIGIIFLITALVLLGFQLHTNSDIKRTEGTIVAYDKEQLNNYTVAYYVNGIRYEDQALYDVDVRKGDKVRVCYDRSDPSKIVYPADINIFVYFFGIAGIMLVYFCFPAFKGYKTEFLDRFPKEIKFTFISILVMIAFLICFIVFVFPIDSIESFLMVLVVPAAAILCFITANIIVWVRALKDYKKKQKILENAFRNE